MMGVKWAKVNGLACNFHTPQNLEGAKVHLYYKKMVYLYNAGNNYQTLSDGTVVTKYEPFGMSTELEEVINPFDYFHRFGLPENNNIIQVGEDEIVPPIDIADKYYEVAYDEMIKYLGNAVTDGAKANGLYFNTTGTTQKWNGQKWYGDDPPTYYADVHLYYMDKVYILDVRNCNDHWYAYIDEVLTPDEYYSQYGLPKDNNPVPKEPKFAKCLDESAEKDK